MLMEAKKMKTAIITGATDDVGKIVSTEFGINDYNVVLVSDNYSKINEFAYLLSNSNKGMYDPFVINEVNHKELIKKLDNLKKNLGSIDVLVNNVTNTPKFGIETFNTYDYSSRFLKCVDRWYNKLPINLKEVYVLSNVVASYKPVTI